MFKEQNVQKKSFVYSNRETTQGQGLTFKTQFKM